MANNLKNLLLELFKESINISIKQGNWSPVILLLIIIIIIIIIIITIIYDYLAFSKALIYYSFYGEVYNYLSF